MDVWAVPKAESTVAVGEIGLDYYWDKESRDCQKKWFITQLDMAKETGLPVNIHSRDAAQETFEIMKKRTCRHDRRCDPLFFFVGADGTRICEAGILYWNRRCCDL